MYHTGIRCHSLDITKGDVADSCSRKVRRVGFSFHTPFHLHFDDIPCILDVDIFEGDILDITTSTRLTFESTRVPIFPTHVTVAHHHPTNTSRDFTAHSHSTMSIVEMTMFYENIFTRFAGTTAILTFPGLDTDTVVMGFYMNTTDLYTC